MMKHSYQYDPKDRERYRKFVLSRMPWYDKVDFEMLIFPVMIGVILYLAHYPLGPSVLVIGISSQFWAGVRRGASHFQYSLRGHKKRRKEAHTMLSFTLTPDALITDNGDYQVHTPWDQITEVTQSQSFLLFMLTKNSGHYIPKASFADPGQAAEFLAAARAYQNGTTPGFSEVWPPPPNRLG